MVHTVTDETTLLRRYHLDGDMAAREQLVARMLPFVRHVARRYANRGEPIDDLFQVGCVGLLKAIDRFDVTRGVRLTSFAEPTVAGEIKRHFRDHGWAIRTPRDLQELNAGIMRETQDLEGRLGRAPTVPELSERLGTSPEHVAEAVLAGRSYHASSLDETDETGEARITRIGAPDDELDRADRRMLLEAGLRALPQRERRIVKLRYLNDLPQHEIARRVGISQMHVSRLLRRSLEVMREQLEREEGEGRHAIVRAA